MGATSTGSASGFKGSPIGPVEKSQTGMVRIWLAVRSIRSFAGFSQWPA